MPSFMDVQDEPGYWIKWGPEPWDRSLEYNGDGADPQSGVIWYGPIPRPARAKGAE